MNVVQTSTPISDAARDVANKIVTHLETGETVLWLLSGGSSAKVALQAAELLHDYNLDDLLVTLTDERYGPVGHGDENWRQLLDAGLSLPGAKLYRPLTGDSRPVTASKFETWLRQAMDASDYTIGIFGIGSDGHTAGIKPKSTATQLNGLVADFKGEDFERITMTFPAIRCVDEIIIQASGDDKLPVLRRLQLPDQNLASFPAAILKSIADVSLYSDLPVSSNPTT